MPRRDIYDFMTIMEKLLFSFALLSFATLAVVQVLMTQESWRNYLNFASRLESQQITIAEDHLDAMAVTTGVKDSGALTLVLKDYYSLPKAYVLVNGREVENFASGRVVFSVRAGDIVEVDGTNYAQPFQVSISKATDNLAIPTVNTVLEVNQDIVSLPSPKFKQ